MAIGAIVGKAGKGAKKAADTMSKKERTALKMKKDAERKATRAAAKTAKKESRQKVAVLRPGSKAVMGGNKPLVKASAKMPMSRSSAGPKRMEKEVKGEVVSASKLKGGDPKSPKSDAGKIRRGGYKKAAAIGAAAAVGATAVATMDSGKKKTEALKSQPKAAASKPVTKTATAASSPGKKSPSEFGSAFKAARKEGKEVFEYKGKKYHSYTKEEVAKMSPEEKKAKRKKGAYV